MPESRVVRDWNGKLPAQSLSTEAIIISMPLQAQGVPLAASILEAAEMALGQSTVTLEIDRSLSRLWTADM